MDKNDNVIEISKKKGFLKEEVSVLPQNNLNKSNQVTNPIAKNFIKYFSSTKGKFSIKDIFR